jgi:hypothetical protein
VSPSQIAHLELLGISVLTEIRLDKHWVVERDGFIALIEKASNGPGRLGAAGLLTEKGLAPLIWRGAEPTFVAKDLEQIATNEQVQQIRGFQADLQSVFTGE